MIALGTLIEWNGGPLTENEIYCGVFDYFDSWDSIDPRLAEHHKDLSPAASALGHDIGNMAAYADEILRRLVPEQLKLSPSVVVVGAMVEAFFYSLRSACDAVAAAVAYVACDKPGQAPKSRLPRLIKWSRDNSARVRPDVLELLSGDFEWFWKLRSLRDQISHQNASAVIHCDGNQFNLWVHSPETGWVTREALLPLLALQIRELLHFADSAASIVNDVVGLPNDRVRSRLLQGVLVPSLHALQTVAPRYGKPSP